MAKWEIKLWAEWRIAAALAAFLLLGCGEAAKPSSALANPPPTPPPVAAVDPPTDQPDADISDTADAPDNVESDTPDPATDQRGAAGDRKAAPRGPNPFPRRFETEDFSDKLIWLNTKP